MTNAHPSLWPSNSPSRGANDPAFGMGRDLEAELLVGLSGPVGERAEAMAAASGAQGVQGVQGVVTEEIADVDVPAPETSEGPGPAIDASPATQDAVDEEFADSSAAVPELSEGLSSAIDGVEAALIEGLSGPVGERAEALSAVSGTEGVADEEVADVDAPALETSEGLGAAIDAVPGRQDAVDEKFAGSSELFEGPSPAIDAGLEAALVEGLSGERAEALSAVSSTEGVADEEIADVDATALETSEGPGPAIDAGLEAALVEGLSGPATERAEALSAVEGAADEEIADVDATALETSEGPGAAIDAVPGGQNAVDEKFADSSELPEGPGPAIDAGLEAALVEGLSGPATEQAEAPAAEPAFAGREAQPAETEAGAAVGARDAGVPNAAPPNASQEPGAAIDPGREAALAETLSNPAPERSEGGGVVVAGRETGFVEAGGTPPGVEILDAAAAATEVFEGSISALAFALDLDTEAALHEALSEFEGSPTDGGHAMVWRGSLQTAIATLAEGHSTPLLLVDVDETPYPAGALHKLATVCDVGTIVIAIGSNTTAQASREILLAGVSDYLPKPITPATVRESIAHALRAKTAESRSGRVAGFLGVGGSGATTIAAATALHASRRGHYVSILDLNRMVPSAALMLDVEPAPGLDHLLEAASHSPPDPEIIDALRTERSARLAVYAYRSSETLPRLAEKPALTWLVAELRRRSHLVLIDGVDDLDLHLALLDDVDTRVLVAEPTARDAGRATRLIEALGLEPPVVLVQNQTRRLAHDSGTIVPSIAGVADSTRSRGPARVFTLRNGRPELAARPGAALDDQTVVRARGPDSVAGPRVQTRCDHALWR